MRFPLDFVMNNAKHMIGQRAKGRKRYPTVLMLEPLYTCNLACIGCSTERHTGKLKDRLSVEKCLEAAKPLFETATATVDPFGSESYGLALIKGKAVGADAQISAICVYDKKAKTVEIGGELPTE